MADTKYELFAAYSRGWRDGACTRAMRSEFTQHKTRPDLTCAYERGYASGQSACRATMDDEARRLGYVPSILRAAGGKP